MKNCEYCNKLFDDSGRAKKYCNAYCYKKSRKGKPRGRRTTHPTIVCETCKKEFSVYPSALKHRAPKFCSPKCFYTQLKGSERAPRIVFNCPVCDKQVRMTEKGYNDGRKHYCSQKCMIKDRPTKTPAKMVAKICLFCGKHFSIYACWANKGEGKFCSHSCCASYTNRRIRLLKGPTSIEQLLMDELDTLNVKYEYQYRLNQYVIDFAIPHLKIAIEADGVYWHSLPDVIEKDKRKDKDLAELCWTIFHFMGNEIRKSPQDCINKVLSHLR